MSVEQRWAITDFIASLSESTDPGYTNLVAARHVQDPIDLENGTAIFESAPVARFPLIGQIMEPGRSFHPAVTSVTVQAVYDFESVALLVRWHDMSPERSGKNDPSLEVPPEEEEQAATPAAGPESDDPFAQDAVDPSAQAAADPFAEDLAGAAPAVPNVAVITSTAVRASREEWGNERSEDRGSAHDEAAERVARAGPNQQRTMRLVLALAFSASHNPGCGLGQPSRRNSLNDSTTVPASHNCSARQSVTITGA